MNLQARDFFSNREAVDVGGAGNGVILKYQGIRPLVFKNLVKIMTGC